MAVFSGGPQGLGWRSGVFAALAALACSGPPGAGRSLGDDLGTFAVAATETENTCGPGALGSRERFDFEVALSRAHTELFWNGSVGGRIDGSLAFELRADLRIELRPATRERPGCTVRRSDEISGVLEERSSEGIVGFDAVMSYAFESETTDSETADSESTDSETTDGCDGGILEESGLPVTPCRLTYSLAAERLRAPER